MQFCLMGPTHLPQVIIWKEYVQRKVHKYRLQQIIMESKALMALEYQIMDFSLTQKIVLACPNREDFEQAINNIRSW